MKQNLIVFIYLASYIKADFLRKDNDPILSISRCFLIHINYSNMLNLSVINRPK